MDKDLFSNKEINENDIIERKLADKIDTEFIDLSKEEVLKQAINFDNSQSPTHVSKTGEYRVRVENQRQKRRVAKIEDYTCQVCSFRFEYKKHTGKPGWIINIDHILEKAMGGNENIGNLWVLCPNCHTKKTYGVITIDITNKKVCENGVEIKIRDSHLFK